MDLMKLCSFMSAWLKMRCDYQCIKLAHEAQGWGAFSQGKLISMANILRRRTARTSFLRSCSLLPEPNQQTRLRNS